MTTNHPTHLIVAGLLRRDDQVVLVRQQGPADPEPSWALPGGVVEWGEVLTEALAREVYEETGLEVHSVGRLVCAVHFQNSLPELLHLGEGPGTGYQAVAFTLEVSRWEGQLRPSPDDPYVREARLVPLPEALGLLGAHPFRAMQEPIAAYLRGAQPPGSVWIYRRSQHGDDLETVLTGN